MTHDLVVWGATGQALVVREAVDGTGGRIVAVFDNDSGRMSPFPGVPIFHGWAGLEAWMAGAEWSHTCAVVAIGGARGAERIEIGERLEAAGLRPWTVIHPRGFVADDAAIGAGSQVMAQAAIATRASLGRWCIVNTSASVDHECLLEDGVHVGPGAHLAGNIHVGRAAMIGAGATLLPHLRVGAGAVIGAGAVVVEDVAAGTVVMGNPARVRRT